MQVVPFDEGDAAAEHRIERALVDPLQVMLADFVGRVRLAGEDQLHGTARRVEDSREPLGVREDQFRPLVAGEAAREPDRQACSDRASCPAATTWIAFTSAFVHRVRARSRMNPNRKLRSDCRAAHSSSSGIDITRSATAGSS